MAYASRRGGGKTQSEPSPELAARAAVITATPEFRKMESTSIHDPGYVRVMEETGTFMAQAIAGLYVVPQVCISALVSVRKMFDKMLDNAGWRCSR